ncbi:hypothetical protein RRG08_003100 [Elysia crispata]|uniref:Uncharacterized protein n=1 Tax=Elysia crispata TaxID=231223 RepID=A0AAE1B6D4_9GAST|nr:hypothetical protein RRG08_003100 [Elysia crispata]
MRSSHGTSFLHLCTPENINASLSAEVTDPSRLAQDKSSKKLWTLPLVSWDSEACLSGKKSFSIARMTLFTTIGGMIERF